MTKDCLLCRPRLARSHTIVFESSHVPVTGILDECKCHHGEFRDVDANVALKFDLSRSFAHERASTVEESLASSLGLSQAQQP